MAAGWQAGLPGEDNEFPNVLQLVPLENVSFAIHFSTTDKHNHSMHKIRMFSKVGLLQLKVHVARICHGCILVLVVIIFYFDTILILVFRVLL